MSVFSALWARTPRVEAAAPGILIAERFVPPKAAIRGVRVPGAIAAGHPGRTLAAIVMDPSGLQIRRGTLPPPTPDATFTEITFDALLPPLGQPLWLFMLDAADAGRLARPDLIRLLLRHIETLGPRPPIDVTGVTIATEQPPTMVTAPKITFGMLSEDPDPKLLPPLDRPDLDETGLTPEQRAWREEGVVILPGFLPDAVLDPYIRRRETLGQPGGWNSPTPYLQVEELRAVSLHPPLRAVLRDLIGEEMMLHLCLTGWVSTERDWHQDDYLNPATVNSWYAAVWIALDTIDPDSGPFEYVPGSHRWPLLRGEKVRAFMTEAERASSVGEAGYDNWPTITERFVAPAIEAEIQARGVAPRQFLGRKGDVLIWHGRLMHRGTRPARRELERRALIAHYSGISHRPDMPRRNTDENGGVWAVFDHPLT